RRRPTRHRRRRRGLVRGGRARAAPPRARRGPRLEGRRPVHGHPGRRDRTDRDAAAVRHARRARARPDARAPRPSHRDPVGWRTGAGRGGLIAAVGLLAGVATQLGQSLLPDGVSQAANSISPWLLVAFLLGSRMPDRRWAALAGFGALALALLGYYGMVQLRFGYGGSTGALELWGHGAVLGRAAFAG